MWAKPILVPEPTILLASGRNRELWKQPFQACAIDADCVKPDGQNSVISFVISKWLLPELSFSNRWSRGTKTLGTRLGKSQEMGPRSVKSIIGHFTRYFCSKTDKVVFQFATSECRRYPKLSVVWIDLSQHYLLIKNIW